MRVVMFYHSLVSDWNHGNAHFLRGLATELRARGHEVRIFEPAGGWSRANLVAEHGEAPLREFKAYYPGLDSMEYDLATLDVAEALEGCELALVHEWNDPELVRRLGEERACNRRLRLLFHDTHHRSVTDPATMAKYDLRHYDGVLAFGGVIRDLYLARGWSARAWTWHEAADTRVFQPMTDRERNNGLVWIGNWGDGERTAELREFLLEPVRELRLKARVHGVRYPEQAQTELAAAGIEYKGWIANFRVPEVFADFGSTVHIPRRPYISALPGIPTIRPFEALACGIPLVSSPWEDTDGLFTAGKDYLVARNGDEMKRHLYSLINERAMAHELAAHGLRTVLSRHTCAHRVDELLRIWVELGGGDTGAAATSFREVAKA